jgi:hypothetical protein
MLPCVRLRSPDGRLYELVHGDLIGRLWSAALPLDDGRVSEAHAMVSLREQELKLIALRGAFAVHGQPLSEVALRPGMEVLLARGLSLRVEEVVLPTTVMGLEGPGLPRQILPGVASLLVDPRLRLCSGFVEGGAAWIWGTGDAWSLRLPGEAPRPMRLHEPFEVGGQRLEAVAVPLAAAGQVPTRQLGGIDAPMHIIASFETVQIHREGEEICVIGGVPARIITELVQLGGPVHWSVLAGQLWPDEATSSVVRSRLDVNLSRLRRKLREAQLRSDLVRTDGAGQVELVLSTHDRAEDRS